jgi:hypothetical protein
MHGKMYLSHIFFFLSKVASKIIDHFHKKEK